MKTSIKELKCKACEKDISDRHYNARFCSIECRDPFLNKERLNKKFKDKVENVDFVECKVCLQKHKRLNTHLIQKHNLNIDEYIKLYPSSNYICESTVVKLSNNVKGEKNPWYNHNGVYSPWSNKSSFYSEESKEKCLNRSYNTKLKYYTDKGLDEESALRALYERQNVCSLSKFIKRYGEEEGLTKYKNRQQRWLKTLDKKSNEEKEIINIKKASKINYKTLWSNELDYDGILYLIKWKETQDLKIGITTRTIDKRFSKNKGEFIVLYEFNTTIGIAFELEQLILRKFKEYRFKNNESTENIKQSVEQLLIDFINDNKDRDYVSLKEEVRSYINGNKT